jgi:hypothetical protein
MRSTAVQREGVDKFYRHAAAGRASGSSRPQVPNQPGSTLLDLRCRGYKTADIEGRSIEEKCVCVTELVQAVLKSPRPDCNIPAIPA